MRKKDLALALAALTFLPSWNYIPKEKEALPAVKMDPAFIKEIVIPENTLPENYRIRMRDLERKAYDNITQFKTDDFHKDPIDYLVARLMMGEREDYSEKCKITDAWTALTRAIYNNTDLRTEILRRKQYSCFNEDMDSFTFLKDPLKHNAEDWLINIQLAREFIEGKYPNPLPGATHYFNPKKVKKIPSWASKMTFLGEMKPHFYYRERKPKYEPVVSFSDIPNIQDYIK
jgi:hypothetical protein